MPNAGDAVTLQDPVQVLGILNGIHCYPSQQRFHFCFETFHSRLLSRCAALFEKQREPQVPLVEPFLATFRTFGNFLHIRRTFYQLFSHILSKSRIFSNPERGPG